MDMEISHASTPRSTARQVLSRFTVAGALIAIAGGCTLLAYSNVRLPCPTNNAAAATNCSGGSSISAKGTSAEYRGRATFNVIPERGNKDTLFLLALSGGGSRSAYLSASVMLKLQHVFSDIDLLSEVDAISSVSGGSLPAAYYAISTDSGPGNRWDEKTVKRLMRKNYTMRWFGNWFWPSNIAKFWFTAYNRTDIMARTLSKNLYSNALFRDLKIGDLHSDRPYLILNATNGTAGQFDESFTFTDESFRAIGSDVDSYSLSRAVMGTAAFPAVFNYMTLRNWSAPGPTKEYVHIFDGGNYDNLGLQSLIKIIDQVEKNGTHYQNLIVILVDAYTDPNGVSATKADPRSFTDHIIDENFLAATDALLHLNRAHILDTFQSRLEQWYAADPELKKHAIFYHILFSDIERFNNPESMALSRKLNQIPTNFSIEKENADNIDIATQQLLTPENTCLKAMRQLLMDGTHSLDNPICSYPN